MNRLDAVQLDNVLKAAGFTEAEHRRKAWAVAMRESSGYYDIKGGPNANGTYDYGLFQINEIHKNNPNVRWELILTGLENSNFAYYLTDGGNIWAPWGLPNFDGSVTGYAAVLKKNDPDTFDKYYSRWKSWYDLYPSEIARVGAVNTAGIVSLANLKPGKRNDDVKEYQTAARNYVINVVGTAPVNAVNPSGATGYYGSETKALTTLLYNTVAKQVGSRGWLPKDLTVPGPAILRRIGLKTI